MFCMAKQFMTTLLSIHEACYASIHEVDRLQFIFSWIVTENHSVLEDMNCTSCLNCHREPFRSRVHELTALPSWIALRGKALKDSGCPCWVHCSIPKRFCKYDTLPKFGAWSPLKLCNLYKKPPIFRAVIKIRIFSYKKVCTNLSSRRQLLNTKTNILSEGSPASNLLRFRLFQR